MYTAPHVGLSGCLYPLPNGTAGVFATIRAMRALVRQWRADPRIVSAARSIVFNEAGKDHLSEARALFRFVQQRVRYTRDVLDVETLASPLVTLQTLGGDCDDHSTLLAALFESIGFPTRFVVSGYSDPGVFEHVYLHVDVDGTWYACDTTERERFGWEPGDAVAYYVEGM